MNVRMRVNASTLLCGVERCLVRAVSAYGYRHVHTCIHGRAHKEHADKPHEAMFSLHCFPSHGQVSMGTTWGFVYKAMVICCHAGYGTEALSYVASLLQLGLINKADLWVAQSGTAHTHTHTHTHTHALSRTSTSRCLCVWFVLLGGLRWVFSGLECVRCTCVCVCVNHAGDQVHSEVVDTMDPNLRQLLFEQDYRNVSKVSDALTITVATLPAMRNQWRARLLSCCTNRSCTAAAC